jgi:hypothetical protein
MRVVVGWIASCRELSLERMDDIHLALETLLAEEAAEGERYTLEVAAGSKDLQVLLYGLENGDLKETLRATSSFEPCERCPLDVAMMLRALVERFEVVEHDDGVFGVRLHCRTP